MTTYTGTSLMFGVNVRPVQVVPGHLCCLRWAVAAIKMGGPFWFDEDDEGVSRSSLKGVYDSTAGESPCPRCDGFTHDNGFCGHCGDYTDPAKSQ